MLGRLDMARQHKRYYVGTEEKNTSTKYAFLYFIFTGPLLWRRRYRQLSA